MKNISQLLKGHLSFCGLSTSFDALFQSVLDPADPDPEGINRNPYLASKLVALVNFSARHLTMIFEEQRAFLQIKLVQTVLKTIELLFFGDPFFFLPMKLVRIN